AELDVDIVLEDGPDSVTIQAEQYQQLVDLKKADPSIPTSLVIEASQLRNKDKLLEMMQQGGIPPQVQQQMQEMQQALQEAQQRLAQAEGDAQIKQAEMALKAQELEVKRMELEIKRFEAETDRIQALKPEPAPALT